MKIVIDLPEKTIAHIRSDYGHGKGFYPLNEEDKKIVNDAIYFGTPLPEHHGRIIDESKIAKCYLPTNQFDVRGIRTDAPTIIEAERSENNE